MSVSTVSVVESTASLGDPSAPFLPLTTSRYWKRSFTYQGIAPFSPPSLCIKSFFFQKISSDLYRDPHGRPFPFFPPFMPPFLPQNSHPNWSPLLFFPLLSPFPANPPIVPLIVQLQRPPQVYFPVLPPSVGFFDATLFLYKTKNHCFSPPNTIPRSFKPWSPTFIVAPEWVFDLASPELFKTPYYRYQPNLSITRFLRNLYTISCALVMRSGLHSLRFVLFIMLIPPLIVTNLLPPLFAQSFLIAL